MNYEEFKERVQSELKNYLGEGFEDIKVDIRETMKVNRIVDQITVSNIPGHGPAAPSFSAESLYHSYQLSDDFDNTMNEIVGLVKKSMEKLPNTPIKDGIKFDNVENNIFFTLVNTDQNRDLLETVPHREVEDLSVIYRWNVGGDNEGLYTNMVTNQFAEQLGKSEEDLYKLATANTKVLFPSTVKNMNDVISEMIFGDDELDPLMAEEFRKSMKEMPKEKTMYVISNEASLFGAASILYDENLHNLAEKLDSDLYILPSSTHEVIAISDKFGTPEELAEMVYEINMEQVDLADRLSNQVYHYDKDARTLKLASDSPNKSISNHNLDDRSDELDMDKSR